MMMTMMKFNVDFDIYIYKDNFYPFKKEDL